MGYRLGVTCFLLVFAAVTFSGCAGTIEAISNRQMTLSAQMSETIFIDPESLAKNNSIFVRVTNTSDFQEIDFAELLKSKISSRGYVVTSDVSKAGHILQANLLYMGAQKQDLTAEGMLVGGFGGGLAGSNVRGGWRGPVAGGLAGTLAGAVIGGVVGSMIHVDTYLGAVDIQIKERVEGGVKGMMKTNAAYGSATSFTSERQVDSGHQEYRTRIVVTAKQTNIDRAKACAAIADRLAVQVGGMF